MMHCTRRRMWPAPEDQTFPTVVFLQVCVGTSRTGDSLLGKDNVTSAHVFVIKPITQNALTSTRANSVAWNVFSFSHVCQLCSMWTTGKSLEFSDNCCMLVPPLGIRSLLFFHNWLWRYKSNKAQILCNATISVHSYSEAQRHAVTCCSSPDPGAVCRVNKNWRGWTEGLNGVLAQPQHVDWFLIPLSVKQ